MRFANDDGTFGVVIAPSRRGHSSDYFRFQLLINGDRFGDEDPSILGSAMQMLMNVARIDDPRLEHPQGDPDGALTLAMNDETTELHDRVVFAHAESLGRWQVVAYQREDVVIWLVRSQEPGARAKIVAVPASDYVEVINQAARYWTEQRRGRVCCTVD